jgi:hypothetical protein
MRVVKKHVALPEWDGTPGKKVLIYGEQGIGDEIMFASMLPDAMRDCREVILDCHPRLVSLFEKNFGVKCYGTRKEPGAEWLAAEKPDAMIAIGSLGKFYRRTRASFPGTSYLKAEPAAQGRQVPRRHLMDRRPLSGALPSAPCRSTGGARFSTFRASSSCRCNTPTARRTRSIA